MADEITTTVPATEVSAPESANANAGKETTEQVSAEPSLATATETLAQPPAYAPNYKYKAAFQEKELDEFWRPLVKDADSEKKVKELFSKVDAFDYMKGKREQLEQSHTTLQKDFSAMQGTVHRFNEAVNQEDLSSAFRIAGLTKEKVFKWAHQQLQLMEMPAEQRAQYEQFERQKLEKFDLEQKVSSLEQQWQEQATQARVMQLDYALLKPEVQQFSQSWDQRMGQPGAFKSFVIEEAKKIFYDQGKDMSSEEAVQHAITKFGKILNAGEPAVQQSQTVPHAQRELPVIPNVTGKAASPVKQVPKTLDDLKRLAKSL